MKTYLKLFILSILVIAFVGCVSAMTEQQFKSMKFNCSSDNWLRNNMKPSYVTFPNNKSFNVVNNNVLIGVKFRTLNSSYSFVNISRNYIYVGSSLFWSNQLTKNTTRANILFKSTSKSKTREVLVSECNNLKNRQNKLLTPSINFNNLGTW